MPKHSNDRLQGTLDLLALKTLAARAECTATASLCISSRSRRAFFVWKRVRFTLRFTG